MIDKNKKELLALNINNWKSMLLDLTLRNKALNLSINLKRTIPSKMKIVYPEFDELLNIINNSSKDFFPFNEYDMIRKFTTNQYGEEIIYSHTVNDIEEKTSLKNNYLYSEFGGSVFIDAIKKLEKKAKTFKEEFSIDIAYLSFGLLKWYESLDSNEPRYAPLLFFPVEIKKDHSFNHWRVVRKSENNFEQNESLVRKMKNDFNIDCEYNEEKKDILENFQWYKNKILSQTNDKRWAVVKTVYLSTFDFSNINIYKDIEQNIDKITQSDFFTRMISFQNDSSTDISQINEENINNKIFINNQFKILDSDSSQEIAIQNAIEGKSFILQGPPGTGKSQTITNIITELISRGKKILFVAEKNAALQVVFNNLKKIGIEKYAIPIHDPKVDKKQILTEINNSIENSKIYEIKENEFQTFINSYEKSKEIIEKYGETLLKKRSPENKNLYEYIGKYFYLSKVTNLSFIIDNITNIDSELFEDIRHNINSFEQSLRNIDFNFKQHPWYGLSKEMLSFQEKDELINHLSYLKNYAKNISKELIDFNNLEEFKKIEERFVFYTLSLNKIAHFIQNNQIKDLSNFLNSGIEQEISRLTFLTQIIDKKNDLINKQKKVWKDISFFEKHDALDVYKTLCKKNPFKALSKKWREYKSFFKKENLLLDKNENNIIFLNEAKIFSEIKEYENNIKQQIDDSNIILESWSVAKINETLKALTTLKLNKENLLFVFESFLSLVNNEENLSTYLNNLNKVSDSIIYLMSIFDRDIVDFGRMNFSDFMDKIIHLLTNSDAVNGYINFINSKNRLIKLNQESFINAVLDSNIDAEFEKIYLKKFYEKLIKIIIEREIPKEDSIFLNLNIENFRSRDKDAGSLAKDRIILNNDKRIKQSLAFPFANPQYSLLKREAAKSRAIIPFKKFFENALDLILTVKPCLMLSPLTVSNFFKDVDFTFDTVIFDEASQIRPESAISSLFRAKQVIVVGDKEQMPPSNFFSSVTSEEGLLQVEEPEENFSDGYESLLNLAEASLSSIKLKWHYRSKFEELIYTSNKEIYKDLITFPNSKSPEKFEGLKFIHATSSDKITDENKVLIHTKRVLKEIIEKYQNKYSIGIVVFNQEMLQKVEKEIDSFLFDNPHLKFFFNEEKKEPFFIKNIETVQGDERDIILFLLENKRNSDGSVSVNFGAINRSDSGYKRLNVAISRAKKSLMLISSFRSNEVDWFRSDKRGIKILEKFMKNAEFGINNLEDINSQNRGIESLFEQQVYERLLTQGLDVKTQVGSSGFRIDLAIVDKNNPNKYILGIECDGATFHSSKTARDRDRLRQQVLESRGWKIHRIWSTDWFKNADAQIDIILDKVKQIYNSSSRENTNTKIKNEITSLSFTEETESNNTTQIFEAYPDIYEFIDKNSEEFINSFEGRKVEIIEELLNLTGAIYNKDFENIVKSLSLEERMTNYVRNLAHRLISDIAYVDDYLFVVPNNPDFKFKFRESASDNTKRSLFEVHPLELQDLFLTILKLSKVSVSLNDFCRELSLRIKSTVYNVQHKRFVLNILDEMAKNNLIQKVSDEVFKFKN